VASTFAVATANAQGEKIIPKKRRVKKVLTMPLDKIESFLPGNLQ
jgi:hypothetical protein